MPERHVPDVRLRPACEGDRDFLREVYGSTRADELAAVPWTPDQRAAFVTMQFEAQDRHYREHYPAATFDVILVAGVPVGRLYVDRRSDEARVVDLALLPDHRGLGIGTHLLHGLMAEAAAAGRRLTVHVEQFNPAQHLYDRLGFRQVGQDGVYRLLAWEPPRPTSGSGEDGLEAHARSVGPQRNQEQRELPQISMVDREGLLLDETVVATMEEQRERRPDGSSDIPSRADLLAGGEHELERLPIPVDGPEHLPDERAEGGGGEGLEHAADATPPARLAIPLVITDDAGTRTISRRGVLTAIGMGVLWTAAPVAGGVLASGSRAVAAPRKSSRTPFDLATATAETFQPHVGTGFRLPGLGRPSPELILEQVVQHSSPDGRTDAFTLVFRPSRAATLAQLTYELDHSALGRFSMFLVPGTETVASVVNHVRE